MDLHVVRASGRQRFDAGGFPTMHQTRRSLRESTWYLDGQSERRSPSVWLARPPAPRRDGRTYSLSAPAASCAPSWNGASNGAASYHPTRRGGVDRLTRPGSWGAPSCRSPLSRLHSGGGMRGTCARGCPVTAVRPPPVPRAGRLLLRGRSGRGGPSRRMGEDAVQSIGWRRPPHVAPPVPRPGATRRLSAPEEWRRWPRSARRTITSTTS